jgi:hypothetical protein
MVFEENLLQYGILGIWTLFNLYQINDLNKKLNEKDLKEDKMREEFIKVVNNNTIALTRTYENLRELKTKKNGN